MSITSSKKSMKLTEFTIFVDPFVPGKGIFASFYEESALNYDRVFAVGYNRCLFTLITFTFFTNCSFKLCILFTSFTLSSLLVNFTVIQHFTDIIQHSFSS